MKVKNEHLKMWNVDAKEMFHQARANPTNVALIQNGVKSVFWTAAVVTLIGLLLVIFIVKPEMSKKAAESK